MTLKKLPADPKIIIGLIVILLIGIAAYMLTGRGEKQVQDKSGAFDSIKDALSKTVSLQCEFTDRYGTTSKVYIKNGAIRADLTPPNDQGEEGSMIIKDNKMYFWNSEGGYVMQMPEDGEYQPSDGEGERSFNIMKELEEYKESCKPSVVSDELFTLPTGVTFTDMSRVLDNAQSPDTNGISEEELQKMTEQ